MGEDPLEKVKLEEDRLQVVVEEGVVEVVVGVKCLREEVEEGSIVGEEEAYLEVVEVLDCQFVVEVQQ